MRVLPQKLGTRTSQIELLSAPATLLQQSETCHCDRHCCAGTCCSANSQAYACTRYELMKSKFDLDTTTMLSHSGAVPCRSVMERRWDLLAVSRTSCLDRSDVIGWSFFHFVLKGMCHSQLAYLSLARLLASPKTS